MSVPLPRPQKSDARLRGLEVSEYGPAGRVEGVAFAGQKYDPDIRVWLFGCREHERQQELDEERVREDVGAGLHLVAVGCEAWGEGRDAGVAD